MLQDVGAASKRRIGWLSRSSKSSALLPAQEALVFLVDAGDDLVVVGLGLRLSRNSSGVKSWLLAAEMRESIRRGATFLGSMADGDDRLLGDADLVGVVVDQRIRQDAEAIGDDARICAQQPDAHRVKRAHPSPVARTARAEQCSIRSRISRAALLVKVTARISSGDAPAPRSRRRCGG